MQRLNKVRKQPQNNQVNCSELLKLTPKEKLDLSRAFNLCIHFLRALPSSVHVFFIIQNKTKPKFLPEVCTFPSPSTPGSRLEDKGRKHRTTAYRAGGSNFPAGGGEKQASVAEATHQPYHRHSKQEKQSTGNEENLPSSSLLCCKNLLKKIASRFFIEETKKNGAPSTSSSVAFVVDGVNEGKKNLKKGMLAGNQERPCTSSKL